MMKLKYYYTTIFCLNSCSLSKKTCAAAATCTFLHHKSSLYIDVTMNVNGQNPQVQLNCSHSFTFICYRCSNFVLGKTFECKKIRKTIQKLLAQKIFTNIGLACQEHKPDRKTALTSHHISDVLEFHFI